MIIRLASDNALFGQPETGLGITPGFGGTQRLMRRIPVGKAKGNDLCLHQRKSTGSQGSRTRKRSVRTGELLPAAKKLAGKIANNAPIAVRQAKAAMNKGIDEDMDTAIVTEVDAFGRCFETEDQREGMKAFLEKRKHEPFTNK